MQQTGLILPEGIPHFGAVLQGSRSKKATDISVAFWDGKALGLEVVANAKLVTCAGASGCGVAVPSAPCDLLAAIQVVNCGVVGEQSSALGQIVHITQGPLSCVIAHACGFELGVGKSNLARADVVLCTVHVGLCFGCCNFFHIGQVHQLGCAHLVVDGTVGLLVVIGRFGFGGVLGGA